MIDPAASFASLKLDCLRLASEHLRWEWDQRQDGAQNDAPPTLAAVREEGRRLYQVLITDDSPAEIPNA